MSNRFFLNALFSKGANLLLEGQEFHHFAHVMRGKVGETIEIVNGKNQLAEARVEKLSKHTADLKVLSVEEVSSKSKLVLAQALFRPARLEWLIEKAVELGVSEIWLFPAARSEKKNLSDTQLVRLEQIAISAMKQCKRLDLPKIVLYPSLHEVPAQDTLLFGDLRTSSKPPPASQPLTLFIGPEGGFTDEEIHYLEQKGALGIHLHQNVLRAETAAIVALSLCQF